MRTFGIWPPILPAGTVTFAQVQTALAAATGPVSFNGQALTNVGKISCTVGTFLFGATVTLDGLHNDYQMNVGEVTGPMAVDLGTLADDAQGTIAYKQDVSGGHAVTFLSGTRTNIFFAPIPDDADAYVSVSFLALTIGGTSVLYLYPSEGTP